MCSSDLDRDERDSVASLMKRAENGDASALSALKERLPQEIDIFLLEEYGQLGQTAENALVKAVAGGNLLHTSGADGVERCSVLNAQAPPRSAAQLVHPLWPIRLWDDHDAIMIEQPANHHLRRLLAGFGAYLRDDV